MDFRWIHQTKANVNTKTTESSVTAELYERITCCEVLRRSVIYLSWLRKLNKFPIVLFFIASSVKLTKSLCEKGEEF